MLSAILEPRVAFALLPFLLPPFAVGAAIVGVAIARSRPREPAAATEPANPLRLWTAVQMAIGFQLVLILLPMVRATWGERGVLASATLLGLTNMDALTFAMNQLGTATGAVQLAAAAIAMGILANTGLKLGIGLALGSRAFQRTFAPGLVALAAASGAGLWIGW